MELVPFPKRWLFLSLFLFGVAVILSSCGTPATSTNALTSAPTPLPEAPPSAGATCQTRQLLLAAGPINSALGNAGLELSLKNQSPVSCKLFGYPTLHLLDAQQKPLKMQITRSTSGYLYRTQAPQVISLPPGEKAYFAITWSNLGCSGAPPTEAMSIRTSFLLVTPPLNQTSLLVAFQNLRFWQPGGRLTS